MSDRLAIIGAICNALDIDYRNCSSVVITLDPGSPRVEVRRLLTAKEGAKLEQALQRFNLVETSEGR